MERDACALFLRRCEPPDNSQSQKIRKETIMSNIIISNINIHQNENGLFSLNDFHKAAGAEAKYRPNQFIRLDTTKDLITELSRCADMRITHTSSRTGEFKGTYVCKELVYAYAMWISPKFHLTVIRTFDEVTQNSLIEAQTKIKQLESQNEKVTPAMKAHMHKLVKVHVNKTKRSHSSVWHEANRYAGASKIDDVLKENYPLFCQFFNAEPMEGEYIPKQQDNYSLLQEKINAALTVFPEYTSKAMAFDNMTRTNAILKVLGELGIDVDSAKKEQYFLWRQIHQWSGVADRLSHYVKNFKVELSSFSQNITQAISYSSNIEDKWKVA